MAQHRYEKVGILADLLARTAAAAPGQVRIWVGRAYGRGSSDQLPSGGYTCAQLYLAAGVVVMGDQGALLLAAIRKDRPRLGGEIDRAEAAIAALP